MYLLNGWTDRQMMHKNILQNCQKLGLSININFPKKKMWR